ncbi:MAG TPA: YidC/Oxa1 family membrane protein insertase [Armatimonadota bacterium]|jgi:YidC/Oxa1 family membrane protein insertase
MLRLPDEAGPTPSIGAPGALGASGRAALFGGSRRAVSALFVLGLVSLAVAGCAPSLTPEQGREALVEADAASQRGSYQAALGSYMKAVHSDPRATTPIPGTDPKRMLGGEAMLKASDAAAKEKAWDQAVMVLETAIKLPGDRTAVIGGKTVNVHDYAARALKPAAAELDRENARNPLFQVMDALVKATGRIPAFSYWFAIVLFTLVVKVMLTPITNMQFRSTRKMMRIQPKLKELQDQYKDRPQEFQQRMMALYREEGVNPFGCAGSMVVQIPIMIALYRVIQLYRTRFAEGHFLWIGSPLSDQFPHILGRNLAEPDWPLLVLYSISMYASQKLTMVPTTDPQQAQQQKMMSIMMPVMFLFILQSFPSAFCLYWLLFNVFTTAQQYRLLKRAEAEEALADASGGSTSAVKPIPRPAPRSKKGGSRKR